ncbi:MAG: peptide ABC transporter substrate-binding protein [Candidatus Ancillula sp.]|jgi:oligopeptide transport system substrate-binding protein|nr:peptide ABC transporter substrate-binding protein [Candidatus Ancillula sp.]
MFEKLRKKANKVKLGSALIVALILPLGLTSCGESKSADTKLDSKQELNLITTKLSTIDADDLRNTNESDIVSQLQESLYRVFAKDGKDSFEYAGATSHDIDSTGTIHTFKIRDNFNWSDGQPVKAKDYADSVKRTLDPEQAFATADSLLWIKGAHEYYEEKSGNPDDVKIKALDDKTLQIETVRPVKDSVDLFAAIYPVRVDLADKYKSGAGSKEDKGWALNPERHVYSGPFKVSSDFQKDGQGITLVKNDKYWDSNNVHITKVNYQYIQNTSSTAETLFKSHQIDAIKSNGAKVDVFKPLVGDQVEQRQLKPPVVDYIILNSASKFGLTSNSKIREALSFSLNKSEYNKILNNGYSTVANEIVTETQQLGDKNYRKFAGDITKELREKYENNPDELKKLFKEGLKELGKDEDLDKVHIVYLTVSPEPNEQAGYEYIKQRFEKELGIHLDVNIAPDTASFKAIRNAKEWDISDQAWNSGIDPDSALQLWTSTYGYSQFFGNYKSEEYDEIYAKLKVEGDIDKRYELYKQLEEQILTKDFGTIPVAFRNPYIFVNTAWKGLDTTIYGATFEYSRAYKVSE